MSDASPITYLVLDTESNGLFDYSKPADADGQPRMASISMILCNENMEIEKEYHAYIRPNGWTMTPDSTRVNGITDEMLNEKGIEITEALSEYSSHIDNGAITVAHNVSHDSKMLRAELRRAGLDDKFESAPNICTMRAMTDICKIPPKGNRGGYKWPALSEALLFIGSENLGDHSAKNDALGALDLLRYLKKISRLPEGAVHYAKQPLGERHPPNETPMMPMPDKGE